MHAVLSRGQKATRPSPYQGEWIQRAVDHPVKEVIQHDGRVRRWAVIEEMGGRYLRVVMLEDRETVHNAFFDRGFGS
jgi:hypothetical protein